MYYCYSAAVVFVSLWLHGLQHTRLFCPLPSPRVCSHSCPLSCWCYLTISYSVAPFSFCLQFFPASGSFPMSWLFSSDCQSTGASASASILPYHGYLSTHNSYVLEDVMELEVLSNHEDCNKFFSLKATTDCSNCQCSRKDGSSQCTVGWLSVHLAK